VILPPSLGAPRHRKTADQLLNWGKTFPVKMHLRDGRGDPRGLTRVSLLLGGSALRPPPVSSQCACACWLGLHPRTSATRSVQMISFALVLSVRPYLAQDTIRLGLAVVSCGSTAGASRISRVTQINSSSRLQHSAHHPASLRPPICFITVAVNSRFVVRCPRISEASDVPKSPPTPKIPPVRPALRFSRRRTASRRSSRLKGTGFLEFGCQVLVKAFNAARGPISTSRVDIGQTFLPAPR